MNTPNPDNSISRPETARRNKLTAIMHRTFQASLSAGNAVDGNRQARLCGDIHHTIKTYLRDRWPIARSRQIELTTPGDAREQRRPTAGIPAREVDAQTPDALPQLGDVPNTLARGWEQAFRAFGEGDVTAADIRLTFYKHQHPDDATLEPMPQPGPAGTARTGAMVPMLRWLLTEATGTIANVAHQLETRAAEIDDDARVQLQDDLIVLDDELMTVKALLGEPIDWDQENRRLLAGEIPPLESAADEEDV